MVKVISVGTTDDYSSAKIMKFLMKFSLPLVKDKTEEYYSFQWTAWKARGHVILFLGMSLVFAALNLYLSLSFQIQATDLFGKNLIIQNEEIKKLKYKFKDLRTS